MKDLKNKVAVITGSASGIGRAIAQKCIKEKMKVVLADIDEKSLYETEVNLKNIKKTEVISVVTNVAKEDEIKNLASIALESFGQVNLLFNNAGVCPGTLILNSAINDWKWIIDVNLWSVIYGINVFIPIMQKQQNDCYIVNTASQAGIETATDNGLYRVTKSAVLSFSEALYHELKTINSKIGVSVLCPSWTSTKLLDSNSRRPAEYIVSKSSDAVKMPVKLIEGIKSGMLPEEVADDTFDAIRNDQFYIFPYPYYDQYIRHRMEDMINKTNPSSVVLSKI